MSRLDGPAGMRLVQAASDRYAELLAEERRHRVADLAEGCGRWPGEPVSVRERLEPGGLADGEGAVVLRVDVPVAVLGDMRGDGAGQAVFVKSLVLVVEDVGPVAAQLLGQVGVRVFASMCWKAILSSSRTGRVIWS